MGKAGNDPANAKTVFAASVGASVSVRLGGSLSCGLANSDDAAKQWSSQLRSSGLANCWHCAARARPVATLQELRDVPGHLEIPPQLRQHNEEGIGAVAAGVGARRLVVVEHIPMPIEANVAQRPLDPIDDVRVERPTRAPIATDPAHGSHCTAVWPTAGSKGRIAEC